MQQHIRELILYPVYINLSYWWNFGVLAFICLVLQIFTGIFLAMFYVPMADLAFLSIERIMRDINYGWEIRYLHANGASLFFLCVYLHIIRNIAYGSYYKPRSLVWVTGIFLLILMIITAFLGYVLPWGQMSFWAATVITSLFSAFPVFGSEIVIWLWGGYSVDNATLNRFFSLHYLLPFVLVVIVILHVLILHIDGSTNPLGLWLHEDKIPFHPYYTWKDLVSISWFLILLLLLVGYHPDLLGHPDNYIMANALVTPAHIVPEWYFLPFYALLRSIPNKILGVLLLASAIIVLIILPFICLEYIRTISFRPIHMGGLVSFIWVVYNSGWLGGAAIEFPFLELSQFMTILYFSYLIVGLSGIQVLDNETTKYIKIISNK